MDQFEQLKLENQLCFPFYAASRLIIRLYQPYLDKLGITYPQYLVLMVLWESKELSVNEISQKLILNTNTLTPLLKRLEKQEIIIRTRSKKDERKVLVQLTKAGEELKLKAAEIPGALLQKFEEQDFKADKIDGMKTDINALIPILRRIQT